MSHGIRRRTFQVLPVCGERITCVQYADDNQATLVWWEQSVEMWGKTHLRVQNFFDWHFVLIAPLKTVRECWCANDGLTGWRNDLGYTIPDRCRQEGGCPEVWHIDSIKRKKELRIANLAEIEEYVVLDHKQVTRAPFAEMSFSRVSAT